MTLCVVLAIALATTLWLLLQQTRRQQRETDRAHGLRTAAEGEVRRLQAEQQHFAAGLAGAPGGLILLDREARVVACNPLAQELAMLPANGGRGRAIVELVAWPQLTAALAEMRGLASESTELDVVPEPDVRDFELLDAPGSNRRCLHVRVRRLPEHGFAVSIEDQSRIKRLESLRRDFVANVSHELKTPLAAIQGYVETMLDDPQMPVATRHRFLQKVGRQSERLSRLVGDLLTLSRLDEPQVLSAAAISDLTTVVRETVRDLHSLAEKRNIALTLAAGTVPLSVRADGEALRQVVGNLVDNAIKYTPERGEVHVRLHAESAHIALEVVDTGIGLSAQDQERIFERFYRVDQARSRDLGGTGLGLSIVKNTVRNLGGEVGVRSQLGHGSTFWVHLPVVHHVVSESS